ncbi:hypothetical protein BAE44_0011611 [Dichanthelium oligosanthes]|uniref:IST1-like protein n=1 Tax=Dichanthelium oligosanthes TaxID=888268 RepID=A0A1E5VQL3_9POAL|nr:hypothetical protein BAE44_0011611 [Dichanthelium oligosanthes]
MGRRLDVLLGRTTKQTARLKSLLGLAVTRLGVVRGHRQVRCAQARGDVEQLLRLGHADRALARAEHVVREQNALDVLADLEAYCGLIVERAALVDAHRECPEELREAAAGLVYAAARCGDLPELQEVRGILASKFGREFVSAASELRSGCGINPKIVQKLSTKQPSLESRQMVLQEIAAEKGFAVHVYEPPLEDHGRSKHNHRRTTKQDEERIRTPPVGDLDEDVSGDSAQRYKDVEAAAQAAFKSAASAAAAAKAAVELSRGEPRGPGDMRKPGRTQMDHEGRREDEMLDGKKSEKIGHARNYSSENEIVPEDEANHGNIAANELKHHEQREPARGRSASVRTKWGF